MTDQNTQAGAKKLNLSERLARFFDPEDGKPAKAYPLTFKEQILITNLMSKR